ncbi:hypothetical protein PsorP6_002389 [Peronosclerospora sorghi]|uniref:Uncharacterized protein n=1 Tax=Peronosclerospora sorghi TaxID=230839 RepID=A0ACC0WQT7_9STRA|nr:hypothetical protein PsorP6_002389 [Peronosclerospora sorghi]
MTVLSKKRKAEEVDVIATWCIQVINSRKEWVKPIGREHERKLWILVTRLIRDDGVDAEELNKAQEEMGADNSVVTLGWHDET